MVLTIISESDLIYRRYYLRLTHGITAVNEQSLHHLQVAVTTADVQRRLAVLLQQTPTFSLCHFRPIFRHASKSSARSAEIYRNVRNMRNE